MKMDTPLSTSKAPVSTSNTSAIDKLRQCKGYEHITDEEAVYIIQSITALCQIAAKAATLSQSL